MKLRFGFLIGVIGWSFCLFAQTTSCPSQPAVLQFPANSATNVQSPVGFNWGDVPGATGYRLWAAFNGGTPNVIALTKDSQYTVNVPAGNVEWWVEALANNCQAVSSIHFQFTAVGGTATCPSNPSAPTLVAPANGASNVSSPVSFSWSPVVGAAAYRIYVQVPGQPLAILGTTSFAAAQFPFPSGTVSWFVEAMFPDCPSTFSKVSTFTVTSGSLCSTTGTTLVAPANGATVNSPVTFQWSPVPNAVGYNVYLGAGNTANDLLATTTDVSLTRIVADGLFTWRVDTLFAGCAPVKSSQSTFTVPPPNACSGSITLSAPLENSSVSSPVTLSWTPIAATSGYRIWASIGGGAPVVIARSGNAAQTVPLPSGFFEWWVEAQFSQCDSILSPHGHFSVTKLPACSGNQPPALVSPINGTQSQSPVTFNWTPAAGALFYRVWVSDNGDPFEDLGVTQSTHFNANVEPGNIQWHVEAFFAGCDPVVSADASFTIPRPPRCQNDTTMLISPANGAPNVTAPVTLVWSAVPNATEYRVFARIGGSGRLLLDRTQGTSSTKILVPGNADWWVEAGFDGCPATVSAHSQFTIPRSANCGTDVPQLIPIASGASSPVTFGWTPVSGAIGYVVWLRHKPPTPPGGVDSNAGPSTKVGMTTGTSLVRRVPEGTIEWWVVAFFASCPPLESTHATFATATSSCSNRAPILMAPATEATGLTSPVHLAWTAVPGATSYKVWAAIEDADPGVIATPTTNKLIARMPAGSISWYVEALFPSCPATTSATSTFSVLKTAPSCDTPDRPTVSVPAQVASGTAFTIHWTPEANATNYELLESTNPRFTGATTQIVGDVSVTLTHTAGAQPTRYFYRVRADSSCSDVHGPYSKTASVLILPLAANLSRHTTFDVGSTSGASQQITLPPQNPPVTFTARADKPWISVSPSSGTIGPQGATLTVTYDPAKGLKLGTNTGTITVTTATGSGKIGLNGVQPVLPVSVSLVTPVTPQGNNNTPPPDSLIIPAVGHAPGANNSMFESDVRVANTSAQSMNYLLNFTLDTPTGPFVQSTTIAVDAGETMALDDILSSFFGIGGDGGSGAGMLEIRPLTLTTSTGFTTTPSIQTVASSRTFDSTPNGTFGQFIPSISFSQFVGVQPGAPNPRISLQQVAQSSAFRTNLGLVEASGNPADVLIHVFDNNGNEVVPPIPQHLDAGQHLQLNGFLQANGIALPDGRIEVEVTSSTGKVSAYASVVDNFTNDPLVVFPVTRGTVNASRYVVPGVADLNNGIANWRSDIRLFNSGTAPLTATLTYSPQPGNTGATKSVNVSIQPGEVHAVYSALQSLFGIGNTGGSILVTTPSNSGLVVTARTFNQTSSGTYGQFIPAVTPADSIGAGDRSLQLLQLESSDRYRTNIGLAETAGSPATARVSLILPDSKFAINVDVPLAANQFVQLPLAGFNAGTVYNGRVSVSVTSGTGKVTAYGSVIDQTTQDPTYVPAQ